MPAFAAPVLNFTGAYLAQGVIGIVLNFGAAQTAIDPAALTGALIAPAPVMLVDLAYDSNVVRPLIGARGLGWDAGVVTGDAVAVVWQPTLPEPRDNDLSWQPGLPAVGAKQIGYGRSLQMAGHTSQNWERAAPLGASAALLHESTLAIGLQLAPQWQRGNPLTHTSALEHTDTLKVHQERMALRWALGVAQRRSFAVRAAPGQPTNMDTQLAWDQATQPRPGRYVPTGVPPPLPPVYLPPGVDNVLLNFLCKYDLRAYSGTTGVLLNFGAHPCPGEGVTVSNRKVYFIVNTLSLKRVQDDEQIHINSVSVGIDKDSWCWAFNANIPYTELEKVEPTMAGPVEVELEINGLLWRILVEEYDKKEAFAKTDISIKGRSVTAYLESPYAPVRSYTQSAAVLSRQLAEAELTRAGLVTGFSLDWQLIDALGWQMPANTWSYSDLTPIQVIQAIAQGAGGFVNSHPADKTLLVLPEYPEAPWDWASAAIAKSIPKTLIKNQNLRWTEKPLYNGVYVSGENTGVTDFIKRTGTDGAFQAPMFVSPMISDHAASRNKGKAILSAGGKQAQVGLELPMEPALGLLTPGMLIEVTNGGYGTESAWRGLVRSTAISAAWGNGLTVSQSIDLERHYGGL